MVSGSTGLPEVHVKDVKWAADGPGENKSTVFADTGIGCDAVGALTDPGEDVRSDAWPKEAEAETV